MAKRPSEQKNMSIIDKLLASSLVSTPVPKVSGSAVPKTRVFILVTDDNTDLSMIINYCLQLGLTLSDKDTSQKILSWYLTLFNAIYTDEITARSDILYSMAGNIVTIKYSDRAKNLFPDHDFDDGLDALNTPLMCAAILPIFIGRQLTPLSSSSWLQKRVQAIANKIDVNDNTLQNFAAYFPESVVPNLTKFILDCWSLRKSLFEIVWAYAKSGSEYSNVLRWTLEMMRWSGMSYLGVVVKHIMAPLHPVLVWSEIADELAPLRHAINIIMKLGDKQSYAKIICSDSETVALDRKNFTKFCVIAKAIGARKEQTLQNLTITSDEAKYQALISKALIIDDNFNKNNTGQENLTNDFLGGVTYNQSIFDDVHQREDYSIIRQDEEH